MGLLGFTALLFRFLFDVALDFAAYSALDVVYARPRISKSTFVSYYFTILIYYMDKLLICFSEG